MMLLPIRFIGAEVRRPEGVTLRKLDAERHPDRRPGFWLFEEATVRIGAEARRLSEAARSADDPSTAQPEADDQAPESRLVPEAAFLPSPERKQSNAVVRTQARPDSIAPGEQPTFDSAPFSARPFEDAEYSKVPYDSLMRAVEGQGVGPHAVPSEVNAFADAERAEKLAWDNDAAESIPYDVLRRVVTDSTADTFAVAKGEPVFAPPENGGEPYGREVPFEDEEELQLQLLNDAHTYEHEREASSE